MKNILSLLAFICLAIPAGAHIEWKKCIGGSKDDYARDIHQTSDGGYIVAGIAKSSDGDVTGQHGFEDCWVVKLSAAGSIEWQKCFGGSSDDGAYCVQQTADGGFIVAGYTTSKDGDVSGIHGTMYIADVWVFKLSSTGTLIWQKCLGGINRDVARSVKETQDGGYIVAGHTYSTAGDVTGAHGGEDAWVVKLSNAGSMEWQRTYGGSLDDGANSLCLTFDGGYIFSGYSYSLDGDISAHHGDSSKNDAWVVKLSAAGNIEWERSFGGSMNESAICIRQTFDSGYIFTGFADSDDGDVSGHSGSLITKTDLWLVKLSATGAIQWNKCVDISNEAGISVEQTLDSGYVVCGQYNTYPTSDSYLWIIKFMANGSKEWEQGMGGNPEPYRTTSYGTSVSQTSDGGYIICGSTQANDGDVSGNHGESDGWVIKMDSRGPSAVADVTNANAIKLLPNPATDELVVSAPTVITSVVITNMEGRVVYKQSHNTRQVHVNVAGLAAGLYLARINGTDVRKFVKR